MEMGVWMAMYGDNCSQQQQQQQLQLIEHNQAAATS